MLNEENNIDAVITLLEEKNNYLELFLEISVNERKSFKARNFDNLEELYEVREKLLKNIQSLDRRIDGYSAKCAPDAVEQGQRSLIKSHLEKKEKLVTAIMEQDLVILSCVENEKSTIIKKMTSMRDGRRLLKAYRFLPDIIE